MANPARKYDERPDATSSVVDPLNPVPPTATDPSSDPRFHPANDPRLDDTIVKQRSAGNGVLIAALVIVLAAIAYFVFAPSTPSNAPATQQPAATETAPAPADNNAAPAPSGTNTAPAPADNATPPAENNGAANPAPDANNPAPAPAQQ